MGSSGASAVFILYGLGLAAPIDHYLRAKFPCASMASSNLIFYADGQHVFGGSVSEVETKTSWVMIARDGKEPYFPD
jgi:hypothetical protein